MSCKAGKNYINLVGFESKTLSDLKLPTNRDVLCLFFYKHRTDKLFIRESARFVLCEVIKVWNKFTLPGNNSHRSIGKIEKLHKNWQKTQVHKARKKSSAQRLAEKTFIKSLDKLFDIAPQNVLTTLNSPQRKVLVASREICKRSQLIKISANIEDVQNTSTFCVEDNSNFISMESAGTNGNINEVDGAVSLLPLSQHSTTSNISTQSNYSTTSDFFDELPVEPKLKKLKLMTPEVVLAMDRVNMSSRQATHLFFTFASALGINLNDVSVSHRTIHRNRIEIRKKIAEDLKTDLRIAQCVVIHWDGKLLPDITGRDKVERLPIILSGVNTQQLLGVPKLDRGTGLKQAIAIKETINEWNI